MKLRISCAVGNPFYQPAYKACLISCWGAAFYGTIIYYYLSGSLAPLSAVFPQRRAVPGPAAEPATPAQSVAFPNKTINELHLLTSCAKRRLVGFCQ